MIAWQWTAFRKCRDSFGSFRIAAQSWRAGRCLARRRSFGRRGSAFADHLHMQPGGRPQRHGLLPDIRAVNRLLADEKETPRKRNGSSIAISDNRPKYELVAEPFKKLVYLFSGSCQERGVKCPRFLWRLRSQNATMQTSYSTGSYPIEKSWIRNLQIDFLQKKPKVSICKLLNDTMTISS